MNKFQVGMAYHAVRPNLNPIEHLWDHLGCAVQYVLARVTNRTTLADLKQIWLRTWDGIPQQNVAGLVISMRLVLLQGRYNRPKLNFLTFCGEFSYPNAHIWIIMMA